MEHYSEPLPRLVYRDIVAIMPANINVEKLKFDFEDFYDYPLEVVDNKGRLSCFSDADSSEQNRRMMDFCYGWLSGQKN